MNMLDQILEIIFYIMSIVWIIVQLVGRWRTIKKEKGQPPNG